MSSSGKKRVSEGRCSLGREIHSTIHETGI